LAAVDKKFGIYTKDVNFDKKFRITGFYINIKTVYLDDPGSQAIQLLDDLRKLEKNYGLDKTFSS